MMKSIGRYLIKSEIGRGAMGIVYLAQDPRLHRQVAVKTYSLPDGISEELAKQFHQRFLREAQAAASLSHPGIVTVYDAGEDATLNLPYIAMEYVPGESLKQRLAKGSRLDSKWVLAFGGVLADALHVAHRAGIVHRDIKPANILIREEDGAVKIADFGVARLKTSDLTQTGASIGSPGYMSPEQVRGGTLDGRSDLFSLAVVLYEALCGKRPFEGDDLMSLAYSIAHDTQIPLSRQLPGQLPGLDAFFDRALAKDPEKRFPDGAAFREAFLKAGSQPAAARIDRTVVDASTMASKPLGSQALPGALSASTLAMPPKPAPGRGRRFGFALGAAVLLAIGLAGAAYLGLGWPRPLEAEALGTRVASSSAAPAAVPSAADNESASLQNRAGSASSGVAAERESRAVKDSVAQADVAPGAGSTPHSMPTARTEGGARSVVGSHSSVTDRVKPNAPTRLSTVPAPTKIPPMIRLTVPAGTEVRLALDTALGSASSQAGDPFTARTTAPLAAGDRVAIPAGSTLRGHVLEAIPAKKGLSDKSGSLSLAFDEVVTPSGARAPISATLTAAAPKSTKKTAGTIGGSAAGGALLGKILGGKTKDAVAGSVIGAAVGTGIAAGTKGQEVGFPAGAPVIIKLDQPITLSVHP